MEIFIIILVLGVIAAITVPKFKLMLYQSREGRVKASLSDLRGALAIYYSDHSGTYPSDRGPDTRRLSESLVPHYLKEMPSIKLPHFYSKSLATVQDQFDDKGGWMYSAASGFVGVNCTHTDTKGNPISSW